jgi:hypothetical protein
MAKKRDLNAFEEVNGAFIEGKLKKFNDYKQMDGCSKVADMRPFAKDIYLEFMRSWAYRTQGVLVDSWQQLTFNEIMKNKKEGQILLACQNDSNTLPFLCTKPSTYKLNFTDENGHHFIGDTLNDFPLTGINLPQDFKDSSLKDILLADKSLKQILFTDGDTMQTKLFTLLPGQNLYLFNPQSNKKRSFFDLGGWS